MFLHEMQVFTTLATNCIKPLGFNFAEKLMIQQCRSYAADLEEGIKWRASVIKQRSKDVKALRARKASM